MDKAVWGGRISLVSVLVGALLSSSCGSLTRQGQASSYLILTSLTGASGADPSSFGTVVHSDVLTVVENVPTHFNDPGQATFQLALKDPGSSSSPNTPSPNNAITLTQYHVEYTRTDGRNVQGVDVPYAFDGGISVTIAGTGSVGFELVRHAAKVEAPLAALVSGNEPITTITRVTFYGHDQTGREVSVSGTIEVTFWNFGDKK